MNTEDREFRGLALYYMLTLSEQNEYRELQADGDDPERIKHIEDLAHSRLAFVNNPDNKQKFPGASALLGEARRTIV